jgi:internalin A
MSALALQRIREAKEQRLTRLDLGNCGLTELPDELFELVWLEELQLSNQWDFFDDEASEWLSLISENGGKPNRLKYIPLKYHC